MKQPVIAIGLDSVGWNVLDRYIAAGQLPHLKQLKQQGTWSHVESSQSYVDGSAPYSSTEGNWVMFQTGVRPSTSGYWETVTFDPATYRSTNDFVHGGYTYDRFAPFYALGNRVHVATFDIPVSAVVPDVRGSQIVGWGGHFPYVVRGSQPRDLLNEIQRTFGRNKILYRDHGVFWNHRYLKWLEQNCVGAIQQRIKICEHLLDRQPTELLIAVLGETHSALHDLWASSHADHPVHARCQLDHDPLLTVMQAVDQGLGRLIKRVGDQGTLMLFSVHGMQANSTDLPCLFFLSELMYRWNFPGKQGIAVGDPSQPPPPPVDRGMHWYWFGEVWRRKKTRVPWFKYLPAWYRWNLPGSDIRFPFLMNIKGAENGWMPAMWYRPSWPRSRSFALPAFADGHIRINLIGREARGVVPAEEYAAECDRVTEFLLRLTDARSGRPIVREVLRTRRHAEENDPRLPLGDLIVVWHEQPFDVVDSPDVGRVGPIPYFRTGGHRAGGFALIKGPGIPADKTLPPCEVFDLAPTLLRLTGVAQPKHLEGSPILDVPVRSRIGS